MRRLLILSCSQSKRPDPGLLPAIERYDGIPYKTLRRYLREHPDGDVDVYILSAEFGLIPADRPIPDYDHRMTMSRAGELRPAVQARLREILDGRSYDDIFVRAGAEYREALADLPALAPHARYAPGGQGQKNAALKGWLYRSTGELMQRSTRNTPERRGGAMPRLRGVEINCSYDEARAIARQALKDSAGDPGRFNRWCVAIDGQRVGVKWLASQLSGLPTDTFVSREAHSVLAQIGFIIQSE